MKIEIDIEECKPQVVSEIFDDEGNVVGQISSEEWRAQRKLFETKSELWLSVICNGKIRRLISGMFNVTDDEARRSTMQNCLMAIVPGIVKYHSAAISRLTSPAESDSLSDWTEAKSP